MDGAIYGVHAVFEALASGSQHLERIYIARDEHPPKIKELLQLARLKGIPVRLEGRATLDRMASTQSHQGVIAITGALAYADFETILRSTNQLIVVLDGVQDPQNLGAVIRTAEACRASGVVLPERHSAPLSGAAFKASAGAAAYVPVARVTNLVSALERIKKTGFWIVGVDASAERAWGDFDYRGPIALVLGGENRGVRRLVREHCDVLVKLPMLGRIESLNVSVAAAVVLYEIVRQQERTALC